MSKQLRLLFISMMTIALGFGFLDLFIAGYDFQRLHIFLYNLATGGTILMYYTDNMFRTKKNEDRLTWRVALFFVMAVTYAILAFFEVYGVSIFLGLVMAAIVESVRMERFQIFPFDFFTNRVPVSKKFHQAAMLCLSIGLVVCSFAIANETYLFWVDFDKLTLNTFFLGFSFPLSLVSLSVAFEMMHKAKSDFVRYLKVISFWTITVGVIIFFFFILFENPALELVISNILFIAVSIVLVMYVRIGIKEQRKAFLTSGILFLLVTSITGVMYVIFYYIPSYDFDAMMAHRTVLQYHAMLALYGWNLTGLAVITRYLEFPIRLHEGRTIALHWIVVLGVAPLGYYFKIASVLGTILYFIFLYTLFFSEGTQKIFPSDTRKEKEKVTSED